MKSKVIIAALCAAVALIFFGCGKDGVYNPSQKISKVYYSSTYNPEKELDQIWEWNDKTLAAIYFDEDKSEGFKFEYDKNDLVTKVSYIDLDELESEVYLKYTYDGKEIEKVEYIYKAENIEIVAYRMTYEYSGGKIVKISVFYNESANFAPKKAKKLLNLVLPKKVVERLPNNIATKADGGFIKGTDIEWTWENENITKFKSTYYDEDGSLSDTDTDSYQYDNKNSPFYNFTSGMVIFDFGGMPSKNNITRLHDEEGDYYFTYEMKYNDKDYPTERTSRVSNNPEYSYTEYYEYK